MGWSSRRQWANREKMGGMCLIQMTKALVGSEGKWACYNWQVLHSAGAMPYVLSQLSRLKKCPTHSHRRTEGLSGSEVLRICDLAATAAAAAQQGGGQRQRAKWGQQTADAEPAAGTGAGGGGGVTLAHFVSVLEAARPCMSHAAAIAYLKWKGHLCAL